VEGGEDAADDLAREEREKVILIAFVGNNSACILAGYPDRAVLPAAFSAQFTAMAGSLRWEETRTREIDRAAKLQLAEAESGILDPAVSEDGARGAIGDIFSGLTALDTSLQVQPGLAERWDVGPDGKTYTYHLRENARFHNGRSVTAEDVLFSWLRAAGPELGSDTAVRYLGDIGSIRDYHERKRTSYPDCM
jgi:ABC-type transport system substrate-binding protein